MLFGGEVLKAMDEVSGSLASMYLNDPDLITVHVGEEVLFMTPIRQGEAGVVVARVVLVTTQIISIYIEVWGGSMNQPEKFTRRYVGFGQCAVLDENGVMRKNLEPYRDPSPAAALAEQVVEFQKQLRKSVLQIV
jgi:hypothetical protein